jgi:hypothetical protein
MNPIEMHLLYELLARARMPRRHPSGLKPARQIAMSARSRR